LAASVSPAPARPFLRLAGAVVLALALPLAACDSGNGFAGGDEKGPRVLELAGDTLQVPDSVRVATVRIDRSRLDELDPAESTIRTGDLLRFIAQDAGTHAIAFDGDAMTDEARAFLQKTGQLRSPPFLQKGSTWVMSFKDAPVGRYPYRCPTHGVQGVINVVSRDSPP
jgi:plastocyanin